LSTSGKREAALPERHPTVAVRAVVERPLAGMVLEADHTTYRSLDREVADLALAGAGDRRREHAQAVELLAVQRGDSTAEQLGAAADGEQHAAVGRERPDQVAASRQVGMHPAHGGERSVADDEDVEVLRKRLADADPGRGAVDARRSQARLDGT